MLLTLLNYTYRTMRPLLFLLPAEFAHDFSLSLLRCLARLMPSFVVKNAGARLATEVMGCKFKNPVGIAAGLDKDAEYLEGLLLMGFGFIEVGTVTIEPQEGNPKPRLFRKIKDQSLLNHMGLGSRGADYVCDRLSKPRIQRLLRLSDTRLGISIAIRRNTRKEEAIEELTSLFERICGYADYVAINFSSPNTPGLRNYQNSADLEAILRALRDRRDRLAPVHKKKVLPLVVKLSPDQGTDELLALVPTLKSYADGVIFSNTVAHRESKIQGGLSGRLIQPLLKEKTTAMAKALQPVPLIACGGIDHTDAADRMACGAKLLQMYTALIYQGPAIGRNIVPQIEGYVLQSAK